jgi:hypothetical protein
MVPTVTADALLEFYRKHDKSFATSRIVESILQKIPQSEIQKHLKAYFGELPKLVAAPGGTLEGGNPNFSPAQRLSQPLRPPPGTCNGTVALHTAARRGHAAACEALIEFGGADVNLRTDDQHSALHLASLKGAVDVCRVLVGAQASVEARNNKQCTPLMFAALGGSVAVCRLLIDECGADTTAVNETGCTVLHLAVCVGEMMGVEETIMITLAFLPFPYRAAKLRWRASS